jgi:hypothetical protein
MSGALSPGKGSKLVGEIDDSSIALVVRACAELLNPATEWKPFAGYPGSLALCVLDAIWSVNARYPIVRGVIQRYRNQRRFQGNPDEDGLPELLAVYDAVGGVGSFIDQVGTRNRVSTHPGAMYKGEAVFRAATGLHDLGVDTTEQFLLADGAPLGEQAKDAWCAIPGQGSGVSWRYLRMLAGLPDVKPDRMVIRFLASALGVGERAVAPDRAVALVRAAAEHFGADQRALDHEIWEYQSGKRSGHDKVSERDQLAELARSFIGAAFPALEKLHVIPTPFYHPWVQVGRDYAGVDVNGPERAELEAMLQVVYPERFSDPLAKQHPEFPDSYTFSFLEGAIRRCAGTGDDQYEPGTPAAQESVDELIRVLGSPTYTMACCRAMSHLTTRGKEPVTFGDITIYPEAPDRDLIEQMRNLIPAAGSAFNRERPSFYDPPHSLIVTREEIASSDPFGVALNLAGRIDRFLLIARLLYAGTYESVWEVSGASTLISRLHPQYRAFKKSSMPNVLMQRVIEFAPEQAPAVSALNDFIDAAVVKRDKMAATSFDIALHNYTRSHQHGDHYDRLISLATALEAILTGSDDDAEGVGLRLRTRAAALLWTEADPGRAIFDDVRHLYNLRSRVVHGARIAEKDLLKWLKAVSTVPDNAMYGVAFSFANDRLRDLVRRAFLARLCLAAGDDPLWKFETSTPVDAALADETQRTRWRQSWRDVLASLGVAQAADPAIRAVDPLAPNAGAATDASAYEETGETPETLRELQFVARAIQAGLGSHSGRSTLRRRPRRREVGRAGCVDLPTIVWIADCYA